MLGGAAVSAGAKAAARDAASEAAPKSGMQRTTTQPLPELMQEWTTLNTAALGTDLDADRARVVAAMVLQSWYRAARARAELVTSKLPGPVEASSAVVSLTSRPFRALASALAPTPL